MSDVFDDFDEFGDDFDIDDMGSEPSDGREATTSVVKQSITGFTDDLMDDKADTIASISKKVSSNLLGKAGSDIEEGFTVGVNELKDAGEKIRKESRPLLKALEAKIPKGGVLESIHAKLSALAGEEDKQNSDDKESEDDRIKANVRELLGEKDSEERKEEKVKEAYNKVVATTTLDAANKTAGFMRLSYDFHSNITSSYYRKSLELKLKQISISESTLNVLRSAVETNTKQFESIVRNTALPDFVKLKGSEAIRAQLNSNIRGKVFNSLLKSNGLGDRLSKNIKRKTKSFGDTTAAFLSGAGSHVEQSNEMAAMGSTTGGLVGGIAGGMFKDLIGDKLTGLAKKTEIGRNSIDKVNTLLDDPESTLNDISEKGGVRGKLANLLKPFLVDETDKNLSISKENLNEVSMFDVRTKQTINDIIPSYLSKIESGIRDLKNGDNTGPLTYDRGTNKLVTSKESKSLFKDQLKVQSVENGTTVYIEGLLDNILKGSKEKLSPDNIKELKLRLYDYSISGKPLSSLNLAKNGFYDGLNKKAAEAFKNGLDVYIKGDDKSIDLDKKDTINNAFKNIRKSISDPTDIINDEINNGKQQLMEELGLVTFNKKTNRYDINKDVYHNLQKSIVSNSTGYEDAAKDVEHYKNKTTDVNEELLTSMQETSDKVKSKVKKGTKKATIKAQRFIRDNIGTQKDIKDYLDKHVNYTDNVNELKKTKDMIFEQVQGMTLEDAKTLVNTAASDLKKLGEEEYDKFKETELGKQFDSKAKEEYAKVKKQAEIAAKKAKSRYSLIRKYKINGYTQEELYSKVKNLTSKDAKDYLEKLYKDTKDLVKDNYVEFKTSDLGKQIDKEANEKYANIKDKADDISKQAKRRYGLLKKYKINGYTQAEIFDVVKDLSVKDATDFMEKLYKDSRSIAKDAYGNKDEHIKSIKDSLTTRGDQVHKYVDKNIQKVNEFKKNKQKIIDDNPIVNSIDKLKDVIAPNVGKEKEQNEKQISLLEKIASALSPEKKERKGSAFSRLDMFSSNIDGKKKEKTKDTKESESSSGSMLAGLAGILGSSLSLAMKPIMGIVSAAPKLLGTLTAGIGLFGKGIFKLGGLISLLTGSMKLLGKGASGLFKLMGKGGDITRPGRWLKKGAKGTTKTVKGLGKFLKFGMKGLKKIPGLGLLIGGGLAINELLDGNLAGAGVEMASGLLSSIPLVGTLGSLLLDTNKESIESAISNKESIENKIDMTSEEALNFSKENNKSINDMMDSLSKKIDIMPVMDKNAVKPIVVKDLNIKDVSTSVSEKVKTTGAGITAKDTELYMEGLRLEDEKSKTKDPEKIAEIDEKIKNLENKKRINSLANKGKELTKLVEEKSKTKDPEKITEIDKKIETIKTSMPKPEAVDSKTTTVTTVDKQVKPNSKEPIYKKDQVGNTKVIQSEPVKTSSVGGVTRTPAVKDKNGKVVKPAKVAPERKAVSNKFNDGGQLKGNAQILAYMTRMAETRNNYSKTGILKDGAGISFGGYQLTQKSGSLKKFMKAYAKTSHPYQEKAIFYNDRLSATGRFTGDINKFMSWLRMIGWTPSAKIIQDMIYYKYYYMPVEKVARKYKLKNPKVIAHLADQNVTGGLTWVAKNTKADTEESVIEARHAYYKSRKPSLVARYLKGWFNRVRHVSSMIAKLLGGSAPTPTASSNEYSPEVTDETGTKSVTEPVTVSKSGEPAGDNMLVSGLKGAIDGLLNFLGVKPKEESGKSDSLVPGNENVSPTSSNESVAVSDDGLGAQVPAGFQTPLIYDWKTKIRYESLGLEAKKFYIGFSRYMAGKGVKLMIPGYGGNRTVEDQQMLYAKGRTAPGKICTWLADKSKHIGGAAIDIISVNGYSDTKNNNMIAKEMRDFAMTNPEYGASFLKITKDPNHVQFDNAKKIASFSAEKIILSKRNKSKMGFKPSPTPKDLVKANKITSSVKEVNGKPDSYSPTPEAVKSKASDIEISIPDYNGNKIESPMQQVNRVMGENNTKQVITRDKVSDTPAFPSEIKLNEGNDIVNALKEANVMNGKMVTLLSGILEVNGIKPKDLKIPTNVETSNSTDVKHKVNPDKSVIDFKRKTF